MADLNDSHAFADIQPRCLSREQAARYLAIGRTLLTRVGPPPVRLGRRLVYDRVDLDRWLDETKSRGRAIKEDLWPEKKDSTGGRTHRTGGSTLSSQTDAEYVKALGLRS
ncbi:MAG: helix-turn-helix domain-containing protein [Gammaproteobacteria bacterium]|nr:helix-turn-helix domain-containing protein [Gammaproteobacteria bacterium]